MVLSAGIVPVKKRKGNYVFLLLRCFKYWDFPKGEVHQNEDPLQSAIRELEEETALQHVAFNWGEVFIETEPYSKGKIARYYLGEVSEDEAVRLLPNPEDGIVEHHEYRWVTYSEATELTNPRIKKVLDWANLQLK